MKWRSCIKRTATLRFAGLLKYGSPLFTNRERDFRSVSRLYLRMSLVHIIRIGIVNRLRHARIVHFRNHFTFHTTVLHQNALWTLTCASLLSVLQTLSSPPNDLNPSLLLGIYCCVNAHFTAELYLITCIHYGIFPALFIDYWHLVTWYCMFCWFHYKSMKVV